MSASRQTVLMSVVEVIANVAVGYLIALAVQLVIFPMLGIVVTVADNLLIGGIFTTVSLLRSFLLRRMFEAIRARH